MIERVILSHMFKMMLKSETGSHTPPILVLSHSSRPHSIAWSMDLQRKLIMLKCRQPLLTVALECCNSREARFVINDNMIRVGYLVGEWYIRHFYSLLDASMGLFPQQTFQLHWKLFIIVPEAVDPFDLVYRDPESHTMNAASLNLRFVIQYQPIAKQK